MDASQLTPVVYTSFADLDLLFAEAERDLLAPDGAVTDAPDPDTVDAFNAQILAGLVSP
jgi:hypothetical protein